MNPVTNDCFIIFTIPSRPWSTTLKFCLERLTARASGLAVHNAMNPVTFDLKGSNYSYGGFYKGFGLTVTAYPLFSAALAWHLGNSAA